jgi:hypothetical protein
MRIGLQPRRVFNAEVLQAVFDGDLPPFPHAGFVEAISELWRCFWWRAAGPLLGVDHEIAAIRSGGGAQMPVDDG